MAKNKKKQHSITTQITLTIVGLVAGTVLLCWLLNVTLLEGYYTRYKQEVLENGFQQINAASEQGILNTSDYDIDFEKICSNGNLTILIITSDGTVVRSSTNGVENLRMQFMEIIMASVQNDDMHLNMKVLKANDTFFTLGCQHDNWCPGTFPDFPAYIPAVHLRHHNIQNNQCNIFIFIKYV